jgi:hypothetical protein
VRHRIIRDSTPVHETCQWCGHKGVVVVVVAIVVVQYPLLQQSTTVVSHY